MELVLAPNVCQHVAIITVGSVRFSYRNSEFNVAKGLHEVVRRARWLGSGSGHWPIGRRGILRPWRRSGESGSGGVYP